ncbi:sugar phosphate isomerase/epimerase family protein [Actinopolymorpha singaporensis]|uniref:Sugar phosphate isomerase/epimerase n=1 Tax=Actinopolymorpha singaporensis TaxID=117157 RepID=A0A1H1SPE5_9ACTN|nr:sugar phosphate isomerase/epimerase [Actinopolymorpha singaporensis]SDS49850.1 Sugar phosphate isomerase/epimerase [Actinopolymorpha singaporensis]
MATPLALQLYTVRDAMAADRGAALARAAEQGFRAVEPFGIGNPQRPLEERLADAREFRSQLDANGLKVVAVHGSVSAGDEADGVYEELEILGTDRLVAPVPGAVAGVGGGMGNDVLAKADGVKLLAEGLNAAAERAAARGVKVGYHNHDFEWQPVEDGTPAYDVLVGHLDPRVFLEVDVYWAHTAGQNPAQVISSYVDRVFTLHVKDGPGVRGQLQTAVGQGSVDNPAAIAAGTNVGYHVIELDEAPGDPFDVSRAGAQWLIERGLSSWS